MRKKYILMVIALLFCLFIFNVIKNKYILDTINNNYYKMIKILNYEYSYTYKTDAFIRNVKVLKNNNKGICIYDTINSIDNTTSKSVVYINDENDVLVFDLSNKMLNKNSYSSLPMPYFVNSSNIGQYLYVILFSYIKNNDNNYIVRYGKKYLIIDKTNSIMKNGFDNIIFKQNYVTDEMIDEVLPNIDDFT